MLMWCIQYCIIKSGKGVDHDEKKWKQFAGGYPPKILKQKDPFGAFWCILVSYKNGFRRQKKNKKQLKSVKKLKTLMPVKCHHFRSLRPSLLCFHFQSRFVILIIMVMLWCLFHVLISLWKPRSDICDSHVSQDKKIDCLWPMEL